MDCQNIVLLLPEFVTNRLSENEMSSVREHLSNCDKCKTEYEEMTSLLNFAEAALPKSNEAPAGYFDSVWQDLYKEIQEKGLNKSKNNGWFYRYVVTPFKIRTYQLASIPVVIFLVSFLYYSLEWDKDSPPNFTLAQRFASTLSEQFGERVSLPESEAGITFSDLFVDRADSAAALAIDWKSMLDSQKRSDAYESFTDILAELVIKMQ